MRLVITLCILILSLGGYCQQSIIAKDIIVTQNLRAPLDTVIDPKFQYEIRFRQQDSSFYNAMSLTGKKWQKTTFTLGSMSRYVDSLLYSTDTLTIAKGQVTLDFPSVAAGSRATLTITVSGVTDGDAVALGVPSVSFVDGLIFTPRVSASGVISVTVYNSTGATIDPPSGLFKVRVIQ